VIGKETLLDDTNISSLDEPLDVCTLVDVVLYATPTASQTMLR
jgi:hypothetical protein